MSKSITRQRGFVMKSLIGLIVFVGISAVAYPKYQVMLVRSKMAEALTLASDAKTKLNEFYIMNNRFPRSSREAGDMRTVTLSKPKFVSDIKIDFKNKENDVVIEVYFNEGEIPETDAVTDFLYLAGNKSGDPGSLIDWTCGSDGIDPKYLPSTC
ncbi:MAG: pilin [Pseudomonadota bacterium]